MKHIKTYKIFESKDNIESELVKNMISYFSKQKFNSEAQCNSVHYEGYFEYIFPYLDGTIRMSKQHLNERDNRGNVLFDYKLYIFLPSVSKEHSYIEDNNKIRSMDEYEKSYTFKTELPILFKILDKIDWYTTYLCITISRCMFTEENQNGPYKEKSNLDEIQSRLSEFDILKDNEIDYISLSNLFEYYDVNPFDKERFDRTLSYQLSRYN